ncbi:hypothetical protein [Nannocystis pusilla]|uniref:Uncharacterized protein n=1 Tax=Nannocystis pusilla TaxID=889268 RepID=A0ABS7U408_9BACT|nr:hypothetical protein [Nannocystis pusilla]MBZ5715268.1 hypothetical protein [Nannocystis pusilla]
MKTILQLLDEAADQLRDPIYRDQFRRGAEAMNPAGGDGLSQGRVMIRAVLIALDDPEAVKGRLRKILQVLHTPDDESN